MAFIASSMPNLDEKPNEGANNRSAWHPPSSALRLQDGIWKPEAVSAVSYPDQGNDSCFLVEDTSYWFRHRNHVLVAIVKLFPPAGPLFDIGGGNGFVSLALEAAGFSAVLVEPGTGALNAVHRGVRNVVQATLQDAEFTPSSVHAVGVFDVVEHIEHDDAFLADIGRILAPGGRVYCTVPAGRWLWSEEDVTAGHFRRYTSGSLRALFQRNGYEMEFLTYFFSWLHLPIFGLRTVPFRLGRQRVPDPSHGSTKADHSLPPFVGPIVAVVHRWEVNRVRAGKRIPCGTSLFCVARRCQPTPL